MWFGKMTQNEYEQILDNVELAFSDQFRPDAKRQEAENQVRGLIALGLLNEADFETAVAGICPKVIAAILVLNDLLQLVMIFAGSL